MATGIGLLPEKVIADIQECISKLGEDFRCSRNPITDDNTNLHRFCSKLEFLLQNGIKERGNLLRRKREYWDYFCHCLTSPRGNIHDGLKFVKSHPELKTSLARGRTFIRFCLVCQCLADTLQCCFMNEEVTSTFYHERSVLRQAAQLSLLLSILYELNDLQFDLSPKGHDLDVSWPTFARKLFDSSHLWQPPSRSISISSLTSCVSQNDYITSQSHSNNSSNIKEMEELRAEIERLENNMEELRQKLERSEQQEEHSRLLADEKEQQLICLTEQLEVERSSHKADLCNLEDKKIILQKEWQKEKTQLTENLNMCKERSKEHTERLNQVSLKYENKDKDFRKLQAKMINLEEENTNISSQSLQLERDLKMQQEYLETQKSKSSELDKIVLQLKNENEALKNQIKKDLANTQKQSSRVTIQSCKELTKKLETTEASLISMTSEKEGLNRSLAKLEHVNKILEQLVSTMERENSKLCEKITIVESNMSQTHVNLEKCKAAKTDLETQISEVKTELQNVVDNNIEAVKELEATKKFPLELIIVMEKIMESPNSNSLELIKNLCSSYFVDNTLKEKINSFIGMVMQSSNKQTIKSVFDVAQPTNNCPSLSHNGQDMSNLCKKEEAVLINELQKELDRCLQEALKLSCQMCVLKDTLHLDYEKVNTSPLNDCDLVENNVESNADCIPDGTSTGNISLDETSNNVNKLTKLTAKTRKLCYNLEAFRHLNHCLISKVQDQERKLSGIAQELEATQKLVASLKLEHNKLQTSEAITRYELKEKRKLLTRLRTQLESTREDWHRMRKSNSDSEAEWQSLRDEFAKRHKQASEESGFIDCSKNFEENETVDGGIDIPIASSPIDISESSPRDDSMMTDCSAQLSSSCEGAEGGKVEAAKECEMPKTRLELLEEQSQSLYQSLVNNATRRGRLEERVLSLVYTSSRSNRAKRTAVPDAVPLEQAASNSLSTEDLKIDNNTNDDNNVLLEDPCSAAMEDVAAPLDMAEETVDTEEPSIEENEDSELHVPGVGDFSDLNSSTDDEDNSAQEEHEEELHYLRRQALHGFVNRFLSERVRHESQEADLNSKVEILQKTNLKLEKEVEKLKQERNDLLAKEADFRKRTEYIFRKERENFNLQLHDFERERSKLHKNFDHLTLELKETTDKVRNLEESLHETMTELNRIQQVKDEELAALQFQHSTESLKYERVVKLDELQLSLATRDEECTKMNEDLKKIVMELDQEKHLSNQLQADVQDAKEQNDNMMLQHTSEISEVKSDNEELKKNLVKLIKEKDKLWKHSEKLSHQQKFQVTDRWMEDSETNNCLGCRTTFSFTIRKHHCRLCGRIFCHSCSNHWLAVASSRNQARICNECFLQHLQLQTEAGKIYAITNVAEDSEDDCEASVPLNYSLDNASSQLVLSSNSSVDPENFSSTTDIGVLSHLVSGPEASAVLESDTLPMYGSVPDLPSFCASRRCSHDNALIQETEQRSFLTIKENLNKQTIAHNPFEEFDVISDEEIAHSLSSYNPYRQAIKSGKVTDSRLHTTITRTAVDIAAAGLTGVKGELWVNAGTQYGVPVICDQTGVLHWEFSTEPQRIAFSVAYKKSKTSTYDKFEMQPLLPTIHVSSSQHCVKGHVVMKNPGVYVLLFDNRFSRISAKKVKYLLLVNNIEECAAGTCKDSIDHE